MASRSGSRSMTTTRSAPRICAARAAICPTPPAPQTATTSPPFSPQKSAAIHPVGMASEANTTESSGHPVRHGERADVAERHPDVLRVAAGVAAGRVRVAEDAGRRVSPQLLGEDRLRVGVVAERVLLGAAVPAAAAGHHRADHHPVADLDPAYVRAGLHHLTHELVAEHVPLPHRRQVPVDQVQVRAADAARPDLDDDVASRSDRPAPARRARPACRRPPSTTPSRPASHDQLLADLVRRPFLPSGCVPTGRAGCPAPGRSRSAT